MRRVVRARVGRLVAAEAAIAEMFSSSEVAATAFALIWLLARRPRGRLVEDGRGAAVMVVDVTVSSSSSKAKGSTSDLRLRSTLALLADDNAQEEDDDDDDKMVDTAADTDADVRADLMDGKTPNDNVAEMKAVEAAVEAAVWVAGTFLAVDRGVGAAAATSVSVAEETLGVEVWANNDGRVWTRWASVPE